METREEKLCEAVKHDIQLIYNSKFNLETSAVQKAIASEIREAKIKMLEDLKEELIDFNSTFSGTPEAKDVIEAIVRDYTKGILKLKEEGKEKV